MVKTDYEDIKVEVTGRIGIITLNRPKALNTFGGKILEETINAVRELNNDPDTVFTVLTGEGRFFSAGADIMNTPISSLGGGETEADAKLTISRALLAGPELVRSFIDHKKVFILALNGPAVGAGAAWFTGIADTVFAADSTYLHVPFSSLGLVPENGAARHFAQSIGVHRANDIFIYGKKVTAQELQQWGMVSDVFPTATFKSDVKSFLERQLEVNDGRSMMITKQLQNAPLRTERLVAMYDAADALHEKFVSGDVLQRFLAKIDELNEKSKRRNKL